MSEKIRTAEMLDDKISRELIWRKKELHTFWSKIQSAKPQPRNALMRGGIVLLYAHWEGFVKQSASAYLVFVAQERLRWEQLRPSFIALGMKAKLNEARQTNRASIYTEVVEFFSSGMSKRCKIPYKGVINTQSNLTSAVFKDIMCMLALDYSRFVTKENLIDEKLVNLRNSIAHGERLQLDRSGYEELHCEVIGMIETFGNLISNAAYREEYLQPRYRSSHH